MPTPVLDNKKALKRNLQISEAQDLKVQDTQDSEFKDDPEKKSTSDGESVDRFDAQNLFIGYCGCNFWDISVSPNNTNPYGAKLSKGSL